MTEHRMTNKEASEGEAAGFGDVSDNMPAENMPLVTKNISIPEAGLKAAYNEVKGYGQSFNLTALSINAFLVWLDGELEKKVKGDPYANDQYMRSETLNENSVRSGFNKAIAEVRRMFLATEPEVPEEIKDMQGIHLESVKDQDDLNRLVIKLNIEAFRRGKESK